MIEDYITYYNTKRLQRNLGILTPMEKHDQFYLAAYKAASAEALTVNIFILFQCSLDGEQVNFVSYTGFLRFRIVKRSAKGGVRISEPFSC